MAEPKGFFRRIFSFARSPEDERVPEHGAMPRASDTEIGRPGSPDPDVRPVAAANVQADTEAGAEVRDHDGGGIVPLQPRDPGEAVAAGDTTQKKTANSGRSRWNG